MIVVDTNIIGALYLSSDRSTQAERALRKDPYWTYAEICFLWKIRFNSWTRRWT
jgi:predicted nucleic acid-binding protein